MKKRVRSKNSDLSIHRNLPDGYRRLNLVVKEEQHEELKKQAILQDSKLYLVVHDAFKEYLANK